MKVLAWDMGVENTACALIEKGKIVFTEKLKTPINNLTEGAFPKRTRLFVREVQPIFRKAMLGPDDRIIAERFMRRKYGGRKGIQIECINIMIGLMAYMGLHVRTPFTIIPASTWKNYYLRKYGENDMEYLLRYKFDPHVADAIGMAYYVFEKAIDRPSKFMKKQLPLQDNMGNCWWRVAGQCTALKCIRSGKFVCDEWLAVSKSNRCKKCVKFYECKSECNKQFNTRTFSCEDFKAR